MKVRSTFFTISTLLACVVDARADELSDIFKKVGEYAAAENYPKAIEELSWANKELEKRHFAKIEKLLPEQLAGFQGQPVEAQSAVGITSIERSYTKGSEQVRLSLAGGSGSGPLAGFAALGRMAGMMGTQPGVDTFR
ncbi:MAG: hypothetical protein KDD69_18995, partial [Bdellovibrionales bacterium]|nr:hypothetical protein [Bdellovibrionales bacterium]